MGIRSRSTGFHIPGPKSKRTTKLGRCPRTTRVKKDSSKNKLLLQDFLSRRGEAGPLRRRARGGLAPSLVSAPPANACAVRQLCRIAWRLLALLSELYIGATI